MAQNQMLKSNTLFISVVIPAYNEERYLGPCLKALQDQDYPQDRYEIIVVDNASTDATAQIAASFGALLIHESKKGVARARQRGAEAARGEIIAGMDADSRPPAHWLAAIDQAFRQDPRLGGAAGPLYLYDGSFWEKWFATYLSNPAVHLTHILGRGWLQGANFAVRKSVFWQVGGFNPYLHSGEDMELALRLQGVTRLTFAPHMGLYVSGRRAQEGYLAHLYRWVPNYIRVVFLKQRPYSGYVADIR